MIIDDIIYELDEVINDLYNFLVDCGITPVDRRLRTLVGNLNDIIAIKGSEKYLGVQVNESGYVTSVIDIDGVLKNQDIPDDVAKGYYKLIDNELVVDEKMKIKLWEV